MVLKSLNTVEQIEEEKKSPALLEAIFLTQTSLSQDLQVRGTEAEAENTHRWTPQARQLRGKNHVYSFLSAFCLFFSFYVLCSALFWCVTGSLMPGHPLLSQCTTTHTFTSFLPTSPSIFLPNLPPIISLGSTA